MLTKWGLSNFKSFSEKTEIDLAPLTVITGTNSSGKSSFIQSILLIAQTLRNPINARELVLNGSLVKMGYFKDIQSDESNEVKICFSYEELDKPEYDNVECCISFNIKEKVNNIVLKFHKSCEEVAGLTAKRIDNESNNFIIESISGLFKNELQHMNPEKIALGNHFLPVTFFSHDYYHRENEHAAHLALDLFNSFISDFPESISDFKNFDIPLNVLEFTKRFLSGILGKSIIEKLFSIEDYSKYKDIIYMNDSERTAALKILKSHKDDFLRHLKDAYIESENNKFKEGASSSFISSAARYINDFFSGSFKYLGPLRFLGSVHPFSLADDPVDTGISGEFTAFVIDAFENKQVSFRMPEYISDVSKFNNMLLLPALKFWLNYLELGENIISKPDGQAGYKLEVIQFHDKKPRNLTQVGVGVSQVLPILVTCLLAENGSTLIFEQPELHLHPKVISNLADFFISMALSGKQCIIETHSEHFIDKLRLRMCQSLLDNNKKIKEAVKIYYFSKNNLETIVENIDVNEYGDYSVWPDGFFDEHQINNDNILNAVNKKFYDTQDDDAG